MDVIEAKVWSVQDIGASSGDVDAQTIEPCPELRDRQGTEPETRMTMIKYSVNQKCCYRLY